jgi:hypothetical protein
VVPDNANTVADAFDVLLEEIEAQINLTDKAGARAFEHRKYDEARQMLDRVARLVEFQDKVVALRLDWEDVLGHPDVISTDEPDAAPEPPAPVEVFRAACVERVETHIKCKLTKRWGMGYVAADHDLAVVCAVSKAYALTSHPAYWFAFHTSHAAFLESATQGYLALGCGSPDQTLLIPFGTFRTWLEALNATERGDDVAYHIHVLRRDGRVILKRKSGSADLDISEYLLR